MSFGNGNTTGVVMGGQFLSANTPAWTPDEPRPASNAVMVCQQIQQALAHSHILLSNIEETMLGPQVKSAESQKGSPVLNQRVPSIIGSLSDIADAVMSLQQRLAEFEKRI